jgi:polyisoprenoid-binding protein YceI
MKNWVVSAAIVFGLLQFAFADAAPAAKSHALFAGASGTTEFIAIGHPSALKVIGKGSGPDGKLDIAQTSVSGTVTVDLKSLNTGIDTRDKHMKEKYLEVEKFPTASLTVTSLTLPKALDPQANTVVAVPFQGTLKLHGVEKPVSGTFDLSGPSATPKIAVQFTLTLSDYGITIPSFAGITIADQVSVTILSTPQIAQ